MYSNVYSNNKNISTRRPSTLRAQYRPLCSRCRSPRDHTPCPRARALPLADRRPPVGLPRALSSGRQVYLCRRHAPLSSAGTHTHTHTPHTRTRAHAHVLAIAHNNNRLPSTTVMRQRAGRGGTERRRDTGSWHNGERNSSSSSAVPIRSRPCTVVVSRNVRFSRHIFFPRNSRRPLFRCCEDDRHYHALVGEEVRQRTAGDQHRSRPFLAGKCSPNAFSFRSLSSPLPLRQHNINTLVVHAYALSRINCVSIVLRSLFRFASPHAPYS